MNTATVSRESAHKWSVRWMARPDFVVVEKVLGPDLADAIDAATALLALNGLDVEAIVPTPNGNATLKVSPQ